LCVRAKRDGLAFEQALLLSTVRSYCWLQRNDKVIGSCTQGVDNSVKVSAVVNKCRQFVSGLTLLSQVVIETPLTGNKKARREPGWLRWTIILLFVNVEHAADSGQD